MRKVLALILVLGVLPAGAAGAARSSSLVRVTELNYVFAPDHPILRPGDTIRWTNGSGTPHTTTSDAPLSLWNSALMQHDDTFDFAFTAAGTYAYHCELHEGFGMFGRVGVAPSASPPSGPVGTVFTVTIASVDAPPDFAYDVQKKNPSGPFRIWMRGVTTATVSFDSTGGATGAYAFRSRLRRISNGAASLYSPSVQITVTT